MYQKKPLKEVNPPNPPEPSELESRLKTTKEWLRLTEIQKRIAYTHFLNPHMTKKDISLKVGCSIATVYNFYATPAYSVISQHVAKQELFELKALSLKAFRECLERGNPSLRYKVAKDVLRSEGVLRDEPSEQGSTDFTVSWNENPKDDLDEGKDA
jgi:hypothetical protein